MRISDWSSDVCSSDLLKQAQRTLADVRNECKFESERLASIRAERKQTEVNHRTLLSSHQEELAAAREQDRKSVVEGKGVSVRVDLGGRSIIKKKRSRATVEQ